MMLAGPLSLRRQPTRASRPGRPLTRPLLNAPNPHSHRAEHDVRAVLVRETEHRVRGRTDKHERHDASVVSEAPGRTRRVGDRPRCVRFPKEDARSRSPGSRACGGARSAACRARAPRALDPSTAAGPRPRRSESARRNRWHKRPGETDTCPPYFPPFLESTSAGAGPDFRRVWGGGRFRQGCTPLETELPETNHPGGFRKFESPPLRKKKPVWIS